MTFTTPEPQPQSLADLASSGEPAAITRPETGTVPAVEAGRHLATQTEYPTRTAVRAGITSFLSVAGLGLAAFIAAAPIAAQAADRILPGTPVGADILAAAAVVGIIAAAVNRISNLTAVAALLTRLHIGPVPKNQ